MPLCTMVEYCNALSEALEHQGEFRGWVAAMLYKDKLYGTFERKDEEPGPFKVFAYLLLEKWFISPEGDVFKTDTEVQAKLNEEIIKYNQNKIRPR